jgi:hypothetical protein
MVLFLSLPLYFDRFCFILPLPILLISWPKDRPPAERPGIPKGRSPFCHNVTTFKISKKISQAFLPCWQWTQATTDLKKKKKKSKNMRSQKTTNFKKQQISIGSVSYLPYRFCIISWLIGRPCPFGHNVTTLKISKKICQAFLLCWQWT